MGENARNLRKPLRGLMFLLYNNNNNNNNNTTYKYLRHYSITDILIKDYSTTDIAKQEG